MTNVDYLLLHYGSIAIFFLLALGIIGLPIPDETLIILAGVLVSKGKLDLIPTLVAVYCGGICGITFSYLLGYTCGHYLIERFGHFIGLTHKKIARAQHWFSDIGKWTLFFGYFILGMRHLVGFTAGMMKLEYKKFALFAYSGVFIWASSVFILGYNFHKTWRNKQTTTTLIGIIIGIVALVAIYSFFYLKQKRTKK